ncbi:MAG: DegT/DnrJ/EryC1/StrS family aminotransferase, partial [Actinomycetota bacterium]|nr:DegT/DnrJ/EryC1/StrS family aminotransferase [Actinomycetota bacterium]
VLAPTFTFIGGVSPIRYVGADPWFVDSERSTWNLDPDLLDQALRTARTQGRRVGAVIAVDLFGQCADYWQIEAICERHGVPLIEDAAEALGATCEGRPAGSFGRAGILSFNGNKIITTSGGGALVSNDEELVNRAFHLATQARDDAPHYEHSVIGYNYRMSNLLAAVGRAQLATLDERVATRRRIFDSYVELLGDIDGIVFMPEAPYGRSNRWLTTLTIDPERFGAGRDGVLRRLEAENIEARPVWKPMHQQPVFAGSRIFGGPVSERIFETGVCLPSGTGLRNDQIERIAGLVRSTGTA